MIEFIDVTKYFKTDFVETTAIDQLTLTVEMGSFLTIVGASGCGKSSLLKMMGLLDKPDQGKIFYSGTDMYALSQKKRFEFRRRNIGFVFQDLNLINELTVVDNVALPLLYQKVKQTQARDKALSILDSVGLSHRAKHYPAHLSGGQQQRVAIARALVIEPGLILADEPSGNLDADSGQLVMDALLNCNRAGTTVVLVTHDLRYGELGDATLFLHNGKRVEKNNS
ncbi:ABC transporter ATP-binding protein [Serratia fonticola]